MLRFSAAVAIAACGHAGPTSTPAPSAGSSVPIASSDASVVSDDERLAAIQKAMNELSPAAQACWAAVAAIRFDIEGELAAQIDIGPPNHVALVRDTTKSPQLAACVSALLADYPWAPPLRGQSIQLPFKFTAPDGQSVIDRRLVPFAGQGKVSVAVLLDENNTNNEAASMFELAIAAGGSTGCGRPPRAELWYFLGDAEVSSVALAKTAVHRFDMMYAPKGSARDVAAPGGDVHAVIVTVPGGREGAARAGALPTPEVTGWRRGADEAADPAGRRGEAVRAGDDLRRARDDQGQLHARRVAARAAGGREGRRARPRARDRAAVRARGQRDDDDRRHGGRREPDVGRAGPAEYQARVRGHDRRSRGSDLYARGSRATVQGKAMTDLDAILAGNVREAARLMRDLDDRQPGALAALKQLFPHTGKAYIVGITGNPGAGKSTVVDGLISHYRAAGERVGVVCIDPTSPFSGGAILGDRIRMQRHALDPGVFIRSLATRGHLGGLSRSTFDITHVFDAMGFERILIETVGVGQDEVDVMRAAHTTVVVTVPGLGDDIQAIKAGLLEVADVLVVNKADREGADRTERDLMQMLDLRSGERRDVAIVRTIATRGTANGSGIAELATAVEAHRTRVWTGQGAAARDGSRQRADPRADSRAAGRSCGSCDGYAAACRDRAMQSSSTAAIRGRSPKSCVASVGL